MEEKKPEGGRKRKTFFEVAEKRRKLSEERNLTRVVLGETFQRWRAMKEQRGVKTDAQFAKILLDRFNSSGICFAISFEARVNVATGSPNGPNRKSSSTPGITNSDPPLMYPRFPREIQACCRSSLRYYVTYVYIKKESQLVGYMACEDAAGSVQKCPNDISDNWRFTRSQRLRTAEWLQKLKSTEKGPPPCLVLCRRNGPTAETCWLAHFVQKPIRHDRGTCEEKKEDPCEFNHL
ncbi:hypothetical protein DPX16_18904 [Anabarilius grahami]|uniref:Uncharacterized protein n=1 Tax=Anabarilius grahami TaxID=495550 RepID=A0A3N0YLN5_ANAGA|nr:hypothetical protein DPX16_18904 [Anabarilius grahami]